MKKKPTNNKFNRLDSWIKKHNAHTVYINPADLPDFNNVISDGQESCPGSMTQIIVGHCLILQDVEVPIGKYWQVPGEHGRFMADCEKKITTMKILNSLIAKYIRGDLE